jgi:hypothetical protein
MRKLLPPRGLLYWCGRLMVFAACGFVSLYILLSGYESIYARPVPFVHTITTVNLSAFSQSYNLNAQSTQEPKLYGYFGKPVTLELPQRSLRLDIVPAIREGGDGGPWLARSDTLQLLIPARPRTGNIGVTFLYCSTGFRTMTAQTLPSAGQNVFMDTDQGWQYVYRVTDVEAIPEQQPFVVSDDGSTAKLVIACNDAAHGVDDVVLATLLSVEGVEQ